MQTGCSSLADSIRLRCIFPSDLLSCCRCLKWPAYSGRHCVKLRGFVLGLAVLACLGSLTLGCLLAYGSGDTGATVTRHMWGGIALCIGLIACLLARSSWLIGEQPRLYPILLCWVLLALLWTAHQGGSLTHGSNYLTRYMPAPLKRWIALSSVGAANPDSFYAMRIHPILDANCVACHGTGKVQGRPATRFV